MKTLDPILLEEAVRRMVVALQPEAIYLYGSHAYGQPDEGVGQYVVYRNEDENPGNAKHQLGLLSEEYLRC